MLPLEPPPRRALPDNEFDAAAHGYGALLEHDADGQCYVSYGGMAADDFLSRLRRNAENGWGGLAIGRIDPQRPNDPPGKVPWFRGHFGREGRDPEPSEYEGWPRQVIERLLGGERGVLNLGARVPVGVVGLDVDQHGNKHGLQTIREHEARLGPLPPTYLVTARPYQSGSGIRLFAVPDDGWEGVGVLAGGHVDLIQRHLRFLAAPGSHHHTGRAYRLYHQRSGAKRCRRVLPPREKLPLLPKAWADHLYRKPRLRSATATSEEVTAFAEECRFDDEPKALGRTVQAVRDATGEGETRPAYHRALWIAARKARAGCYPWERARDEIERAARDVYSLRGMAFDEYDFARSVEHAITGALDLTEDALKSWGSDDRADGWRPRGNGGANWSGWK